VKWKFGYTYERIQLPHAKGLARPLLDDALARLKGLEHETP
jgi:hypothetical protein